MYDIIQYHKYLPTRENFISGKEKYILVKEVIDQTNCPPTIAFEMLELYDAGTVINMIINFM